MKEVEGKQVLLETLEKRIGNMATELEPSEVSQLDQLVKQLSGEHCELATKVKGEMDKLQNASHARNKFEVDVEGANTWLNGRLQNLMQEKSQLPLKAVAVQALIDDLKVILLS